MERTELFTMNEIRKKIETKKGFLVMRDPLGGKDNATYFACGSSVTGWKDFPGLDPNQRLEGILQSYHYDIEEKIKTDFPKAAFRDGENMSSLKTKSNF